MDRKTLNMLIDAINFADISKLRVALAQTNIEELNGLSDFYKGIILENSYQAYRENNKAILSTLIDYGIDPNFPITIKKETLLNMAIRGNDVSCVKLLLSSVLIDVNINHTDGISPLLYAARTGNKEIVDLLVARGAIHEGPLPNKISQQNLDRLIATQDTKYLDLPVLLAQAGYDQDLSYYKIAIPSGKFDSIDFSRISLEKSFISIDIYAPSPETLRSVLLPNINFTNCNLKHSDINGLGFLSSKVNITGSHIEGLKAIADRNSMEGFSAEQINSANITFIENGRSFKQGDLIGANAGKLNDQGICNGLCIEYARYHSKERDQEGKVLHDNFITKLSKEGQSENFLNRVNYLQDNLQYIARRYMIHKEINPANDTYDISTILADDKFKDSNIIGVNFARHATAFRIIRNTNNEAIGYRYFDPNLGESPILTLDELEKHVRLTMETMSYSKDDRYIMIHNLEDIVKQLNIISLDGKNMHLLEVAMSTNNFEDIKKHANSMTIFNDKYMSPMFAGAVDVGSPEAIQILLENIKPVDYQNYSDRIVGGLISQNKLTKPIMDTLVKHTSPDVVLGEALQLRKIDAALLAIEFGANLPQDQKVIDRVQKSDQTIIHRAIAAREVHAASEIGAVDIALPPQPDAQATKPVGVVETPDHYAHHHKPDWQARVTQEVNSKGRDF